MKNVTLLFKLLVLSCVVLINVSASAQTASPHTLRGESVVSTVSLKWKTPSADKTMQWHTDYDYDGESGISKNGEIPQLIIANRFTVDDLKEYKGATIDSISFFHYRAVLDVYVLLYENEKVVREQKVDFSTFKLNQMHKVVLEEPYVVQGDATLTVAVKFVHGPNVDFVGIMDKGPVVAGKGDLYSYDGVNWMNVKRGNFLVTAHIKMAKADDPKGYNIYRGDTKINDNLVAATNATFKNEPKGTYNYKVTAVYDDAELASNEIELTNTPASEHRPIVNNVRSVIDGLKATVTWNAPILADKELTWNSGEAGQSLGTTSGTVRRLWAVNSFSANSLLAYSNHQIKSINVMLGAAVKEMKIIVLEDNVITYFEDVPAEVIATLNPNEWNKFTLAKPYAIEPGKNLRFGYYIVHEKNLYPAKMDVGPAVLNACYIATSAPKSSGFADTTPYWSNIEKAGSANWMISADVEALGQVDAIEVAGYDVYRDEVKVASGVTKLSFADTLEPGEYTYNVVANYKTGLSSSHSEDTKVTALLPSSYIRPMFSETTFENGLLNLKWDVFADLPLELKHHGEPTYCWELMDDENDVDVYMGAEFSTDDLAPYADYEVTTVNLFMANEVKSLEVMLCSDGKALSSKKVENVTPNQMFAVELTTPVNIPAGKSLVVGYHVVYAKDKYAITLDGGPGVTGGGMISFDGKGWYAVSRIDKTFDNNVIVNATVRLKGSTQAYTLSKTSEKNITNQLKPRGASALQNLKEALVFDAETPVLAAVDEAQPTVKSYRLYCNNELVVETDKKEYTAQLPYGSYHTYAVSAVYTNGWESALSDSYYAKYQQPNLSSAPYALSGELNQKDLSLMWQSPEQASELNWQDKTSESLALGLVKSSGIQAYFFSTFAADELSDKVNEYITHIKFGLYETNITVAAVAICFDRNIVYEQNIDVATLLKGENVIRLDKPIKVPANREVAVGYYLEHPNNVKPNLTDKGPAVDERGNWIYSGSWKTLKSMNASLDQNWRISAVLQKENVALSAATRAEDTPSISYRIYHNRVMLVDGISATNYVITNASAGDYVVVAVNGEDESAPSNVVSISASTGVDEIVNGLTVWYDKQNLVVVVSEFANISAYNSNGQCVKRMYTDKLDVSELSSGVYMISIETVGGYQKMIKVIR